MSQPRGRRLVDRRHSAKRLAGLLAAGLALVGAVALLVPGDLAFRAVLAASLAGPLVLVLGPLIGFRLRDRRALGPGQVVVTPWPPVAGREVQASFQRPLRPGELARRLEARLERGGYDPALELWQVEETLALPEAARGHQADLVRGSWSFTMPPGTAGSTWYLKVVVELEDGQRLVSEFALRG